MSIIQVHFKVRIKYFLIIGLFQHKGWNIKNSDLCIYPSIIYGLIITLCLPNMVEGITVFIAKSIYNEYSVNTSNINVYKH